MCQPYIESATTLSDIYGHQHRPLCPTCAVRAGKKKLVEVQQATAKLLLSKTWGNFIQNDKTSDVWIGQPALLKHFLEGEKQKEKTA